MNQVKREVNMLNIKKLFDKPKIIGICANTNEGKSNLIYDLLERLKGYDFKLYSYGLRNDLKEQKIYSIEELETIENAIIFADEFFTLFDLEDRKKRKLIENSLRLINHNNNVLILSGLPENFKKFISGKLDIIMFKKCTLADFINGSRIKNIFLSYKGKELGSAVLNLKIDEALIYDGTHYDKINVPYYKRYDTKRQNQAIIKRSVKSANKVQIKCPKGAGGKDEKRRI